MNKKGFTLIELLAVIAVLAIVALIAVPAVNRALRSGENSAYEDQVSAIITGARSWSADEKHFYELPAKGESKSVTLGELKKDGYVDSDIKNPKTGELFDDNCTKVDIGYDGKKLSYKINLSTCPN